MKPQILTIQAVPMGKPRMTRRDKWQKRECVTRYRAFADELREAFGLSHKLTQAPLRLDWRAYLPMPESWSRTKRESMRGQPHRQKPDRDNIDKAILDALFQDDSAIAQGVTAKYWDDGNGPRIVLHLYWE